MPLLSHLRVVRVFLCRRTWLPCLHKRIAGLSWLAVGVLCVAPAHDARGDVVYFTNGGGVLQLGPQGTASAFVSSTPQNHLGEPVGIAADGVGNLFVSNTTNGYIVRITPNGSTSDYSYTPTTSTLYAGLAFANGSLYAAEPNNGAVVRIASDGTATTLTTGLNRPAGLAVDANGDVYASGSDGAISRISPAGAVSTFASGTRAGGLAFDRLGNLFAIGAGNDVLEIAPDGSARSFATGFTTPVGLAFDSAGNLFVADYGASDIVEISLSGQRTAFAQGASQPFYLAVSAVPEPSSCLAIASLWTILLVERRIARSQ